MSRIARETASTNRYRLSVLRIIEMIQAEEKAVNSFEKLMMASCKFQALKKESRAANRNKR